MPMSFGQAVVDMVMDQGPLRLGHRPLDGVQLRGEVKAGLAFFDHCDDAAQVPFGALEAGCDGRVACVAVWF